MKEDPDIDALNSADDNSHPERFKMSDDKIWKEIRQRIEIGLDHSGCNIECEAIIQERIDIVKMVVPQIPVDVLTAALIERAGESVSRVSGFVIFSSE